MDAMLYKGGVLLLGGTGGERRRARLTADGRLFFRPKDPTGVKLLEVSMTDGSTLRTPYGNRAVRLRRRASKIAKQARKVNR